MSRSGPERKLSLTAFSWPVRSFFYFSERGRVASSLQVLFTFGLLVREDPA